MKKTKEYFEAEYKATKECGSRGKIFEAGFDFAMAQPKHIFDGVAQVGEVRRFEGELVDVVERCTCYGCALFAFNNCKNLTGCDHKVKYIKR